MSSATLTKTAMETVQQGYAYFGEGNIPALVELMDDNVVWKDPGKVGTLYVGTRNGKSEVMEFFKSLNAQVNITKFDIDSINETNGNVFATGALTGTGLATGLPIDTDWAMFWKVVNGKVTYHHLYTITYILGKALGV